MIFITIILALYCVLLFVLQTGWHKAVREREAKSSTYYPLVSVVVPVRNEQLTIGRLLNALRDQTYGNFEVIVVNDHSSDNTVDLVMQHKFPNVSIIDNREIGKKSALETGISQARGELIVTTDGDCVMNKHWIETMHKAFANEKVVFAFGAVGIQVTESFFSKLQAVEFASLIGSGAATSALGLPTLCNGANIAFRKTAFSVVNGYEGNKHIPSGDDEFLMRKINNQFPGGVKFVPYRFSSVLTLPKDSLAEFVSQRLRWAGKWKYNSSARTVALAIFIFAMQFCVMAGYVSMFKSFTYSIALLLLVKFIFEGSFILRVCRFTSIRFSLPAFLFLQVFYPLYVIFIGIVANFVKPTWKGRK